MYTVPHHIVCSPYIILFDWSRIFQLMTRRVVMVTDLWSQDAAVIVFSKITINGSSHGYNKK